MNILTLVIQLYWETLIIFEFFYHIPFPLTANKS